MKELYLLDLIDEETKNAIVGYKWGVHARSFILFHEANFVKKGDKIAYLFVRCFSSEENRFESCDDSSCIMEKLHISQPYITSMLKDGVSDSYDIFAKEDGFYKFMCQHLLVTGAFLQEELANKVKWFESNVERNFNENPLLFVVYETIVEYCRHEFCKYTIIKDEFSGTKCIKWNNRMGFPIKQDSNYMSLTPEQRETLVRLEYEKALQDKKDFEALPLKNQQNILKIRNLTKDMFNNVVLGNKENIQLENK